MFSLGAPVLCSLNMQQAFIEDVQKGSGVRNPKPTWMTEITSVAPRLVLRVKPNSSSIIVCKLYLD